MPSVFARYADVVDAAAVRRLVLGGVTLPPLALTLTLGSGSGSGQ